MSIQTSLMSALAKVQRSLYDNNIKVLGRSVNGMKISYKEDIFQNKERTLLTTHKDIEVIIHYPDEMPLSRFRMNTTESVQNTRTYFFDILPIEIYTKFGDGFVKGDYLYHSLQDENKNLIPILLQITESFGIFSTEIIWKKYFASLVHGQVSQEILDVIRNESVV